jgi:small-conductance mechanosensitive channel
MAARGRIAVSSLVLAVGVVIALQQVGISTDIILILVAAVSFGIALTLALAFGLGAVPVARQVAAGRHVKERHAEGQMVRVGEVEGRVASIGLATTRIESMDGGFIEIPHAEFLAGNVEVLG